MKKMVDDRQMSFDALFEIPRSPAPCIGSLEYAIELRHLMSEMLKKCPHDRFTVAGLMSKFLGKEVTKSMLDSWTAESREEWRFPFEYAAAFEAAVESYELTNFHAKKRGCKVLIGKEALLADLGKIKTMQTQLSQQERLLKQALESGK